MWIGFQQAQNKVWWRAIVETLVSLGYASEGSLFSLVAVGFSRRTLFHGLNNNNNTTNNNNSNKLILVVHSGDKYPRLGISQNIS
jgi:hypothetical protein